MNTIKIIFIISFIMILNACSGTPSESKNQTDINEYVNKKIPQIDIVNFKKVNALESDEFGVKYYSVEFEGTAKANEHFILPFVNKEYLKPKTVDDYEIQREMNRYKGKDKIWAFRNAFDSIVPKRTFNIAGKMRYIKKENGWEVQGTTIRKVDKLEKDCKEFLNGEFKLTVGSKSKYSIHNNVIKENTNDQVIENSIIKKSDCSYVSDLNNQKKPEYKLVKEFGLQEKKYEIIDTNNQFATYKISYTLKDPNKNKIAYLVVEKIK